MLTKKWLDNASFLLTCEFASKDKVGEVGFVLKMIKVIWQITHKIIKATLSVIQ